MKVYYYYYFFPYKVTPFNCLKPFFVFRSVNMSDQQEDIQQIEAPIPERPSKHGKSKAAWVRWAKVYAPEEYAAYRAKENDRKRQKDAEARWKRENVPQTRKEEAAFKAAREKHKWVYICCIFIFLTQD